MMRRVWDWFVALVLIVLSLMVVWGLAQRSLLTDIEDLVHAVVTSGQPVESVMPPCITEDAPGPCYWNAREMGDGTGHSFTVDAQGRVTYWDGE
jgi:hypothetical protein